MPAVVTKPGLEGSSPKGKKMSKEYGSSEGFQSKKPGGKRSFLERAKRFGKQGRLGRGADVDIETYTYFVRILELLRKDEFEEDDERDTLVENALGMAEEKEVHFSSNQLVSRVIENMLPLANEDKINSFCVAFTPSLRVVVSDPYASHVLEKLLELTSSDKWRGSDKLTAWFEKTSMFVLNNFEDFTFDIYGSFVTKKVLECLSGHLDPPSEQDIFGRKESKSRIIHMELYGDRTRNPKWQKILQDFAKRFAAWPQFNDLLLKVETSRLLQNVIQTVNRTEKSQDAVKQLTSRLLTTLPATLEADDAVHRTIEVALSVADEKTYATIFNKYYKGNLVQYIHGPCHTLQKLISTSPNEKFFTAIFDELMPGIKTVVAEGRVVIIHHLAVECAKYETKQDELWKMVKDALNNVQPVTENILLKLVSLRPKDEGNKESPKFSSTYFGSSLVQLLMDFKSPVVSNIWIHIGGLKTPELMKLALDPKASFIVSKLFKSWNVPQELKEKLLVKLKDSLVELATTKFGSRIIDLIWLWADVAQKTTVATALSQRIPVLSSNKYGRFHVETMGLQSLVRNKKEWTEHVVSQEKRKRDADKIASGFGITSGSPIEQSKSAKKAAKRKSEIKEEVVEEETRAEPETPKKKKKKNRKSQIESDETKNDISVTETPKKKKNRKSEIESDETKNDISVTETPKKKKNRKSEIESDGTKNDISVTETPKKKKNRKSEDESSHGADLQSELEESNLGPKKSKKKRRKSEHAVESEAKQTSNVDTEVQGETSKKNKKRNSESLSNDNIVLDEATETETPSKKKRKSIKNGEEASSIAATESDYNDTPKKKKKKNKKQD